MYKLLLVDDSKLVIAGFRDLVDLEGLGIEIAGVAWNGMDALRLAEEINPDILVTDIKMPKMDGIELIESIRKKNKDIKIVILSGYSDFEYARKALRFNATEYILKPMLQSDIEETLRRIVDGIKSERAENKRRMYGPFSEAFLSTGVNAGYSQIVRRVVEEIEKNYMKELLLKDIAKEMYISKNYLTTLFKKETGISYMKYITNVRICHAVVLLRDPKNKVCEIAGLVGYDSDEYFYKIFKETMGVTPKEYRNGIA